MIMSCSFASPRPSNALADPPHSPPSSSLPCPPHPMPRHTRILPPSRPIPCFSFSCHLRLSAPVPSASACPRLRSSAATISSSVRSPSFHFPLPALSGFLLRDARADLDFLCSLADYGRSLSPLVLPLCPSQVLQLFPRTAQCFSVSSFLLA